jgi:menaquinone-dependent protoporphyrinogen oxidase
MTVLVAFATIEGQTAKIARFVESEVRKSGREVELVDVSGETLPISFDGVSEVILAAPVHERRHPKPFEVFLAGQHDKLESRRTLLISVSLSAAFEDGLDEANEYFVELKMRTGFTPDAEALVAGAVRPGSYDYFQSQIVRHVVLRDHDYEPGNSAHEFTDWNALSSCIADFLKSDT